MNMQIKNLITIAVISSCCVVQPTCPIYGLQMQHEQEIADRLLIFALKMFKFVLEVISVGIKFHIS